MGRAIDVSPSMAIFNWLRTVFGKTSKEIIYSPAGNRQIKNGRDHYYTGAVRAMHYNHVHWAYDQGGVATGAGPFWKGKKPERVLSPSQTRSFDQLVQVLDRSTGPGSAIAAGATIDYRQLGDQVARALSGMAVKLDGRQVGTVLGASAALMGRA